MAVGRWALAALCAVLTGAILWASLEGAFLEEGAALMAMPWGVVTLADLYSGFVLAALAILLLEPRRRLAVVLALSVFFLGNIVTLAWAVARWRLIRDRLSGRGA